MARAKRNSHRLKRIMGKEKLLECKLSEALATALTKVLDNWDDTKVMQEREESRQKFQGRAKQIADEAIATERLDAKDFAFRINATR